MARARPWEEGAKEVLVRDLVQLCQEAAAQAVHVELSQVLEERARGSVSHLGHGPARWEGLFRSP